MYLRSLLGDLALGDLLMPACTCTPCCSVEHIVRVDEVQPGPAVSLPSPVHEWAALLLERGSVCARNATV
eukprot:7222060-Prymnesium_polylepis.1